jgi:uncharacterized coiled-coil protein SlyX
MSAASGIYRKGVAQSSLNNEIEQLRKAFAEKTKEIAHLQTLLTAIEDKLLAVG